MTTKHKTQQILQLVGLLLLLGFGLAVVNALATEGKACYDSGGVFVRTLFWFDCIQQ
jgi:hypothetical protein